MAKRANGEGSVFQVRRGGQVVSWRATLTVGFDKQGNQVRITGEGKTRRAALERREQNLIKHRVKMGEAPLEALKAYRPAREKVLTVSDWFTHWLASLELQESTYLMYESRIRLHINPALGEIPLRLLEGKHVLDFFQKELPKKTKKNSLTPLLGKTALRSIYFLLFAALEDARKQGKLAVNPCEVMKPPKRNVKTYDQRQEQAQLKSWAPEQLAKHLQGHPDEARWLLGLVYGWRQSEILGLTEDCISWGKSKRQAKIYLRQQLARNPDTHDCPVDATTGKWTCGRQANSCPQKIPGIGLYIKKRMKTEAGYRVLPLVEPVYSLLKTHLKRQAKLRKSPDFTPLQSPGMDKLVFTNEKGFPRRHQVDSKEWHALLAQAHIPDTRGHSARAWVASLLVQMGVDEETLKLVGGWTNDSALDFYVHRSNSTTREPLEALGKRVTSRRKAKKAEPELVTPYRTVPYYQHQGSKSPVAAPSRALKTVRTQS